MCDMIDLKHGDCLELMKEIPSGSVDMVLTDPPYGTTACKWDSVIPFEPMWEQLKRVIKPNGAIVLFGSEPFSSALRMSHIKNYKYDWVWDKVSISNPQLAKYQPLKQHENIIVFSINTHNYNPQGLVNVAKRKSKSSTVKSGYDGEGKLSHIKRRGDYNQEKTGYPKSIQTFSRESKPLHPTQKPVALLEYLIKTYTQENETVLDFTMGSGSTGVGCINTNRNFIGIEMDDKYFEIAEKRIKDAQCSKT